MLLLLLFIPLEDDSAAKTTAESPKSAIFNIAESVGSDSSKFSGFKSR